MQPSLRPVKTKKHTVSTFRGLCLRTIVPDGYFAATENVSAAGYPALTTRGNRMVINECGGISAMYMHGEMLWVEDGNLYYGSEFVGMLTPGPKQFAALGARILIYPDKLCFHCENKTLVSLENTVTLSGVSASPAAADGSDAAAGSYARLSAPGIGAGFQVGDGVRISGFENEDLNGVFVLQAVGADDVVILAALDGAVTESGPVTLARTAPDLDFLCVLNNRVWGCRRDGHEICACKLGDPFNWNCFEGISTDSYAAAVASSGPFTGVTSNLGNVIFFKETEILKLYGTRPSNFQLISSRMPGIARDASATLGFADSTLFYLGPGGVYAYDGSTPVRISEALGDTRLSGGCAGVLDGRYYLSSRDAAADQPVLLVYDAATGIWQREDGGEVRYFVETGSDLYMAFADGKTYTVNHSGLWYPPGTIVSPRMALREARFSWFAETGGLPLTLPGGHYAARLHLRLAIFDDSAFRVLMRISQDEEWQQVGSFIGPREEVNVTLPLHARRATSLFVRLEGTGRCMLRALSCTYEEGGEA